MSFTFKSALEYEFFFFARLIFFISVCSHIFNYYSRNKTKKHFSVLFCLVSSDSLCECCWFENNLRVPWINFFCQLNFILNIFIDSNAKSFVMCNSLIIETGKITKPQQWVNPTHMCYKTLIRDWLKIASFLPMWNSIVSACLRVTLEFCWKKGQTTTESKKRFIIVRAIFVLELKNGVRSLLYKYLHNVERWNLSMFTIVR